MKTLTQITTTMLFAGASLISFNSSAEGMSSYMEGALVDTCKAAMSDSTQKLTKTLKEYRLKEKTVALGVVCNGEDIITFAQNHGANKTAEHMSNTLGESSITDLAAETVTYSVSFTVAP
ncbi:DUF3718 domain-containing protein [Thalassomonas sp. M1454]|uniref:DUF3718 domain-containing protein n=1 Tax=Thalassomonas sp. M1454 TaxID=2594477 RepID=UPI00117F98D8|nr:DUF3718 domain-containing protein [Thalassomonas sp. M1454]TRX57026.1 DUF3718 domain-containing protein [Thalassomonas sp. M1454]